MPSSALQASSNGRLHMRVRSVHAGAARPAVRCGCIQPVSRQLRLTVKAASKDVKTRAAAELAVESPVETVLDLPNLSYSRQYDAVFKSSAAPVNRRLPLDKPSKELQAQEDGGKQIFLSDVVAVGKRPLLEREWNSTDITYTVYMAAMHLMALAAPFTFSWPMFWLFLGTYFVTGCFGITLSFHRQLSHRSFSTPKWLEYVFAYCGVLSAQGDPTEWVSSHRYHHLHCDTALDPHSPYEGFWWSHMGWVLDNEATLDRVGNRANANDLSSQPFYRFIAATYPLHIAAMFGVLYLIGGFPALVWGGALRLVWVYHITWLVNSASHVWGYQSYKTDDLSRNNWWVALLAWGEGWHNNHHAFEFSARHGLEWWQLDVTWMIIRALESAGLATDVKLPSEKQKSRLAFPRSQ